VQPVLTQVPPGRARSTIATFMPAPASLLAKDGPAWPVPMMIASNSGMGASASVGHQQDAVNAGAWGLSEQ
jgi:hypothetical protein